MTHAIATGSQAPELEFKRADGTTVSLSQLWAEGPLLVLWLRQCG
jgi:peroxiredoxin